MVEEHNTAKQQIMELNSSYFNLQQENESITKNIDVHVNDVLSSFLTKNQIDILLKHKKWKKSHNCKNYNKHCYKFEIYNCTLN